jgi:GTP-binding protein
VPIVLVFTKADKLARSKVKSNVSDFLNEMAEIFEEAPLYFITSSETSEGREELIGFIEENVEEFYKQH